MVPKKLSDSDKKEILNLYRQPEETTSTLANRYGVSNTTISRILKLGLSEEEYGALVQQKRAGGGKAVPQTEEPVSPAPAPQSQPAKAKKSRPVKPAEQDVKENQVADEVPEKRRITRKRSQPVAQSNGQKPEEKDAQLPLLGIEAEPEPESQPQPEPELKPEPKPEPKLDLEPQLKTSGSERGDGSPVPKKKINIIPKNYELESEAVEQPVQATLDGDEDFMDLDDDDDLDDLDDDDFDDEEDALAEGEEEAVFASSRRKSEALVQILPLSAATLPKICYLVIDRTSELITRPLREFGELGQIPEGETQERTLPIFDNHRVARRFSKRMQRIIKIPDGRMLQKVTPYLQAKGITRLLIDGQVYAL